MTIFTTNASIRSFGGTLLKLSHQSSVIGGTMNVNVYFPPQAEKKEETGSSAKKLPLLFFLAGLTSTQDNCAEKGFLQPSAAKHGIAIVYPDTSPRGFNIPGEESDWDIGTGAGFYLDAVKDPWSKAYKMYSYITEELPKALCAQFSSLDQTRMGLTGFSMGGHGALTLYLKNPDKYKSVSAFAPITNPSNGPWGKKVLSAYLGEDRKDLWAAHDATELIKKWPHEKPLDILIDQGSADKYIDENQLLYDNFLNAAKQAGNEDKIKFRLQQGYDHSYYFVSTFIEDHIAHHARYLLSDQ